MKQLRTLAVLFVCTTTACSPQRYFLKSAWLGGVDYLTPPEATGAELTKISDRVYSYRDDFYQNLVITSDEGLIVTDPMGVENAQRLKAELDKTFPGQPVHTMIYSHYHLDHVSGGAVLGAKNILAHASCPKHWAELGAKDVATPTQLLASGDQHLSIGGVELELIYFEPAHADALYAYYLPKQKILHSVDMGFVQMIPPFGIPDSYMPGVLSALDRVAELDFDVWIPSHYKSGHKADLVEYIEMTRGLRKLVS